MRIELGDGKYATGFDEHGVLFFERRGEPWAMMAAMKHIHFMRVLVAEVGRLRELEYQLQRAQLRTSPETFNPLT